MARRRTPRELRRRSWTESTVWELLASAELLPYRFASPLADLGMTPRQRRELRCEAEVLKVTRIAYMLPQIATSRRPSQPWLYVRAPRGGYYRVGEAGEIDRYGARVQRLGSGSITDHGWYPCSLRGVRWLQVIAEGRLRRAAQALAELPPVEQQAVEHAEEVPVGSSSTEQLSLPL